MFREYKKQARKTAEASGPEETQTLGFEEPPPPANYEDPPKPKGTIEPYPDFTASHAEETARELRDAMKGLGTDELTLIQILTQHSNEQRQEISRTYKTLFGRDLLQDFIDETSGSFRNTLRALMMPSRLYDAWCIKQAMEGLGTDEILIIDILCPRTNEEIRMIKEGYKQLYPNGDLEDDLKSETSGDLRRLLVSVVQANRDEGNDVNETLVKQDAKELYKAGEGKVGTDEEVFNRILAKRSWSHIKAISREYVKMYGMTLSASIKGEFSGHIKAGLLAIVLYAEDPINYFVARLYRIKESRDSILRFLVAHSETDLHEIKQRYHQMYKRSLEHTIASTESGDFAKLLIKILNPKIDNAKLHNMVK